MADMKERLRTEKVYPNDGAFTERGAKLHNRLLREAADTIERLEKALEPFADFWNRAVNLEDTDKAAITIAHLRAAARALEG